MKYTPFIFIASTFFVGILFSVIDHFFNIHLIEGINIIGVALLITLIFIIRYKYIRKDGDIFGSIDIVIFKVILAFIEELDFNEEEVFKKIKIIFKSYSPKQVEKLFNEYNSRGLNLKISCSELKPEHTKAKIFVFYALFDICASDKFISQKESDLIYKTGIWLKIHKNTIDYIKQQYKSKGVKSEKDIFYNEARKKAYKKVTKPFLPYKAYKVLGVSQKVTEKQLKKVYRNLAKKYHPDKYYGKNDKIIQQMETKFQEITEAYELIKKYIKLN